VEELFATLAKVFLAVSAGIEVVVTWFSGNKFTSARHLEALHVSFVGFH
jgi:hypothetical protein